MRYEFRVLSRGGDQYWPPMADDLYKWQNEGWEVFSILFGIIDAENLSEGTLVYLRRPETSST